MCARVTSCVRVAAGPAVHVCESWRLGHMRGVPVPAVRVRSFSFHSTYVVARQRHGHERDAVPRAGLRRRVGRHLRRRGRAAGHGPAGPRGALSVVVVVVVCLCDGSREPGRPPSAHIPASTATAGTHVCL